MEIGLVLNMIDSFDKLKLHLVVNVELLVALTNLHFEVVVSLLYLADVHFLKLQDWLDIFSSLTLVIWANQLKTASF